MTAVNKDDKIPTKIDAVEGEERSINPARKAGEYVDDKPKAPPSKLDTDQQLDHGLKETFPASDPVSINPGAD